MKAQVAADKEAILAVFKRGQWLRRADIVEASGVDKANYALGRLTTEGKLAARGATTNREWSLATKQPPPGPRPHAYSAEPLKIEVALPAQDDDEEFIPAMASGQRMVLILRGRYMILTVDQTQAVADLIFENFEAGE